MADKKIDLVEWAELDAFVHELGAELGIDVGTKKDVACHMSDGHTILVPECVFNDYKDAVKKELGIKSEAVADHLARLTVSQFPEDFKGYPLA